MNVPVGVADVHRRRNGERVADDDGTDTSMKTGSPCSSRSRLQARAAAVASQKYDDTRTKGFETGDRGVVTTIGPLAARAT